MRGDFLSNDWLSLLSLLQMSRLLLGEENGK